MGIKRPEYIERHKGVSLGQNFDSGLSRIDYPVFCFRHLHGDYGIEELTQDNSFAKQFLKKINLISGISWTDIQLADRRGHGAEKISKASIQKPIPTSITHDVKDFLSFYFHGDKGRIVGYRNQMLFHIVFIDTKLDVYRH